MASSTSSPTLPQPNLLAHMHPTTSSLQTGSETNDSRTSIPSTKRGRSPSSSSVSGSSTVSIVKRRPAFDQEEVDIDMDELRGYEEHFPAQINTTVAGAVSTSTTYPAFAHPCVWAERRARFMLPYTLENAPCHQGFDTENELFAHYAWHVDQLGVDYECEVTTCRMKILSGDHMKTHYQQMHPALPIPQELHSITNTIKPTGRAVSATATIAAGGRSQSKRISATPRESLTPTPPPSVPYINPPPTSPSKSRMQSKLQQTTILSEGGKMKAVVNGTFPYNSTTQGNPTTTMTHSEDDDEEEDPTPPMAFGPFFKKK
ncbi:hypothetical protein BGX24_011724 [Mortierella sp. AD032]|nr:hypothetical protein BGX24_011724 [Mortierella sp. AD032]